MPTPPEIDFGLRILREIVTPAIDKLEHLISANPTAAERKEWAAMLCSSLVIIRQSLPPFASLIPPTLPSKPGVVATDVGCVRGRIHPADALSDEATQLLADAQVCKGGHVFTDPTDPRYQEIQAYRERVARLLHQAVLRLSDQGNDDAIDCVKSVISTIKCLMLDVPQDRSIYQGAKKT